MKHKNTTKIFLLIITISLFFMSFIIVLADTPTHEINNFEELLEAAELSKKNGYQDDSYVLKNDIEIKEEQQNIHISFGTSENPFNGTFDGEGHKISNLKYESTLDPKTDTGLFSYTTTGCVIKNLIIDNADIQADYRGGLVSGYSKGTIFENISIQNSHLFVTATNNVLTLITDGGLRGGALVGEAENCVVYNCESINTTVNTNSTSGVSALSGKGLYLGGLIGTSISTEVEYSRVIDGLVKNYYDVAVGALGGNTLYVGGIIGQMKEGSKVIDCFSTSELYFYCATYVSIGAGNSGHIGGITGAMYGERNEILRSHYAGKASSKQYNAILVIPIIENNKNISGITDVYEGGSVVNTYFKPSVNSNVDMKVLGNNTSTSSYGPLTDERYIDQDYWQTQNYDFYGISKRQTAYNNNHTNQWIIDNEKQIPIHGDSIAASLDMESAGKVTISSTDLINSSVSTEKPYKFAMQGMSKKENIISFIKAEQKQGYRFVSWYKIPNVTFLEIDKNHSYYDEIFSQYEAFSTEKELNNIEVADNDLFIARYQAKVIFHNINGEIIDKNTGETVTESSENDWYYCDEKIPNVIPTINPTSDLAKLIGWTTTKSDETRGGYSSITSAELTRLKNNNAFYEVGDNITKTMNLYPVYIDLLFNITTIFEGNEQDSKNDVSRRDGVGYTSIKMNDEQDVVISVIGTNEDGTFKDGYKFIGWYDENNKKVSTEKDYVLKNVDLTTTHTYTVKFEYRVDYYPTTKEAIDANFNDNPYASIWHEYKEIFKYLQDVPLDAQDSFSHWATDSNSDCDSNSCSTQISNDHEVIEPMKVYAHVTGSSSYDILITNDFPNASIMSNSKSPAGINFTIDCITNEGYNFIFWGAGAENGGEWTNDNSSWKAGIHVVERSYHYNAFLNTNIKFYDKTGNEKVTVTRHYKEKLLNTNNVTHTYKYPITGKTISGYTDISVASPSNDEMKIDGYKFLGWISSIEVEKDSEEWNYIYDVENDLYCTSSASKARPYLLSDDAIVEETFDVYPVYAKWNIITKTNVTMGNITSEINVPENPNYVIDESNTEIGAATLKFIPDTDTYVMGTDGKKYILASFCRVYEDGTEEEIMLSDNNYKYTIEAGPSYTFMAKYVPYIVIYNLNENDKEVLIKENLEILGDMPKPTFAINDTYVAIGWTDESPQNNKYHMFDNAQEFENENMTIYEENMAVTKSIELWPVYISININVNSNIDNYLTSNGIDLETVRYTTKLSVSELELNAKTEDIDDYEFIGWYKNYENEENQGKLLTKNNSYILPAKESIENETYTAVYKAMHRINYYNTKGEIIYTVNVHYDENRTFVNNATDDEGNGIKVPIDTEAYSELNNSLEKNELFQNWQWEKNDGTIVKWEEFYDETIEQNMNLYPIIRKITVKDSTGNEIDVTGNNEKEPDILLGLDNEKMHVCFNITYEEPNITINIEDISYNNNGVYETKYIKDNEVNLYSNKESTRDPIVITKTDENGDAKIDLLGEITITRSSEKENSKEDLFIFQIIDKENNIVNEILLSQNESKTIKIPYGNYIVIQEDDWAWRYIDGLSENIAISNNNIEINIMYVEERLTNKWFDTMTHVENEYK